jgi:hypothetical protein
MEVALKFAKIVFRIAGLWGLALLTPMFFLINLVERRYPPAITHPDFYYGFLGVALAWQVAFLVIATDPIRYRPLMVPAMLEKFIFVISVGVLYAKGRIQGGQLMGAGPDLVLGIFFVFAFLKTSVQPTLAGNQGDSTKAPTVARR